MEGFPDGLKKTTSVLGPEVGEMEGRGHTGSCPMTQTKQYKWETDVTELKHMNLPDLIWT